MSIGRVRRLLERFPRNSPKNSRRPTHPLASPTDNTEKATVPFMSTWRRHFRARERRDPRPPPARAGGGRGRGGGGLVEVRRVRSRGGSGPSVVAARW